MFKIACGFILVELMLALVIGLLIISTVLEIYFAAAHCYQQQTALNNNTANASNVLAILNDDIHQAGHIGCARLTIDFPITSYPPYALTAQNKLRAQNDSLTISYMQSPPAIIVAMPAKDHIQLLTATSIKAGQIVVIADCMQAEIAMVKEVVNEKNSAEIIFNKPLQHRYQANSEMGALIQHRYFIATSNLKNADGKTQDAFFQQELSGKSQELVTNITAMHFTFTVNNNGILLDVPANDVHDWSQVKGVAVTFIAENAPYRKQWFGYVAMQ